MWSCCTVNIKKHSTIPVTHCDTTKYRTLTLCCYQGNISQKGMTVMRLSKRVCDKYNIREAVVPKSQIEHS